MNIIERHVPAGARARRGVVYSASLDGSIHIDHCKRQIVGSVNRDHNGGRRGQTCRIGHRVGKGIGQRWAAGVQRLDGRIVIVEIINIGSVALMTIEPYCPVTPVPTEPLALLSETAATPTIVWYRPRRPSVSLVSTLPVGSEPETLLLIPPAS